MIYLAIAGALLLLWFSRGEGVAQLDATIERERLLRELDIQRNLTEEFREAYLRQKAIYERDVEQVRSNNATVTA